MKHKTKGRLAIGTVFAIIYVILGLHGGFKVVTVVYALTAIILFLINYGVKHLVLGDGEDD